MPVTGMYPRLATRAMRFAPAAAFCAAFVLVGCLLSPAEEHATAPAASQTEDQNAKALRDQAPLRPGVPRGCSLEWDVAVKDSVLNCPDIRPPSPDQ